MRRIAGQTAIFSAESEAEAFIFGKDGAITNISPAIAAQRAKC